MPNPFAVLGLPESFDLDARELHRRYIALSAAAHPDRFTDPLDQADAAQRAAEINEAYRTLADPESRAGALLELWGGEGAGGRESRKTGKQENTKSEKRDPGVGAISPPPDLLAQMMEMREELDAALAAGDGATLTRLRQWAERKRREHLIRIGELFQQVKAGGDAKAAGGARAAGGGDPAAIGDAVARVPLLKAIRLELNGLRYIQRMIEQTPG